MTSCRHVVWSPDTEAQPFPPSPAGYVADIREMSGAGGSSADTLPENCSADDCRRSSTLNSAAGGQAHPKQGSLLPAAAHRLIKLNQARAGLSLADGGPIYLDRAIESRILYEISSPATSSRWRPPTPSNASIWQAMEDAFHSPKSHEQHRRNALSDGRYYVK